MVKKMNPLSSYAFNVVMNGIINWKTTLLGFIGLINGLVENSDVILSGSSYEIVRAMMPSVGVFVLALLAKDADKTGIRN